MREWDYRRAQYLPRVVASSDASVFTGVGVDATEGAAGAGADMTEEAADTGAEMTKEAAGAPAAVFLP